LQKATIPQAAADFCASRTTCELGFAESTGKISNSADQHKSRLPRILSDVLAHLEGKRQVPSYYPNSPSLC
jgi:hypothetical protein